MKKENEELRGNKSKNQNGIYSVRRRLDFVCEDLMYNRIVLLKLI